MAALGVPHHPYRALWVGYGSVFRRRALPAEESGRVDALETQAGLPAQPPRREEGGRKGARPPLPPGPARRPVRSARGPGRGLCGAFPIGGARQESEVPLIVQEDRPDQDAGLRGGLRRRQALVMDATVAQLGKMAHQTGGQRVRQRGQWLAVGPCAARATQPSRSSSSWRPRERAGGAPDPDAGGRAGRSGVLLPSARPPVHR